MCSSALVWVHPSQVISMSLAVKSNRASVYKEQNMKIGGSVEVVAYCIVMAPLQICR